MRTAEANFTAALASHNKMAREHSTAVVNAVSGAVVRNSFGLKARLVLLAALFMLGVRSLQTCGHDMRWWSWIANRHRISSSCPSRFLPARPPRLAALSSPPHRHG